MPKGLKRYYGAGYWHFLTFSCYQRRPLLGEAWRRDLFLAVLEQARRRYKFVVAGYVVMPEHVHLLLSEPERGDPSVVMQVVKQSFVRRLLRGLGNPTHPAQASLRPEPLRAGEVWQRRFYDFMVWTEQNRVEQLRSMHRNPVRRGLVLSPEQWAWSSFRHYAYGEVGAVVVNQSQRAELKVGGPVARGESS